MIPTVLKDVEKYLREMEQHLKQGNHKAMADTASIEESSTDVVSNLIFLGDLWTSINMVEKLSYGDSTKLEMLGDRVGE